MQQLLTVKLFLKRMKTPTRNLPISAKAYATFVERIDVITDDRYDRMFMIEALDKYLAGDRENYNRRLQREFALAFEMLRFDIDAAIERSKRARQRAEQRKQSQKPQIEATVENPSESMSETPSATTSETSTETDNKRDKRVSRNYFQRPSYVKERHSSFRKEKPAFLRKSHKCRQQSS